MTINGLKKHLFFFAFAIFFLGFFYFPSSKSINNFYYLLVTAPFIVLVFLKKVEIKPILRSKVFIAASVFLLYMWLTLFWGEGITAGEMFKYGRRVFYVLVFMASTMHLVHTYPNFLKRLFVMFCSLAALAFLIYSIVYYAKNPFPETRLWSYGLLYNPIRSSSIYGISFLACLYLLYSNPTVKNWVGYPVLLVFIFSYMLLSQARGPMIALVGALVFWQVLVHFRNDGPSGLSKKFLWISVFLLALAIAAFLIFPKFFQNFFIERGFAHRFQIWSNYVDKIAQSPFFGNGLDADTTTPEIDGIAYLHPHSFFLATLFYGGLTGLFSLLFLLGLALYKAFRIKDIKESFFVLTAISFGMLCMVTDGNTVIQHPKPFWIFFWFPIALSAASEYAGTISNISPCAGGEGEA